MVGSDVSCMLSGNDGMHINDRKCQPMFTAQHVAFHVAGRVCRVIYAVDYVGDKLLSRNRSTCFEGKNGEPFAFVSNNKLDC
jgi:hypothetical protein